MPFPRTVLEPKRRALRDRGGGLASWAGFCRASSSPQAFSDQHFLRLQAFSYHHFPQASGFWCIYAELLSFVIQGPPPPCVMYSPTFRLAPCIQPSGQPSPRIYVTLVTVRSLAPICSTTTSIMFPEPCFKQTHAARQPDSLESYVTYPDLYVTCLRNLFEVQIWKYQYQYFGIKQRKLWLYHTSCLILTYQVFGRRKGK